MFNLVSEKTEGPKIKLPASVGSLKKQESSRKTSTSALLITDRNKLWRVLQEMGIPDQLIYLLRNLSAGQEATEPDMGQPNGSELGKEYNKGVYCDPAYLTSMQSTSCEMQY